MDKTYNCKCGKGISDNEFEYLNCTNEEGEDYAVIGFDCAACKLHIDGSQWGHCESETEALNLIAEKINNTQL